MLEKNFSGQYYKFGAFRINIPFIVEAYTHSGSATVIIGVSVKIS